MTIFLEFLIHIQNQQVLLRDYKKKNYFSFFTIFIFNPRAHHLIKIVLCKLQARASNVNQWFIKVKNKNHFQITQHGLLSNF